MDNKNKLVEREPFVNSVGSEGAHLKSELIYPVHTKP